MLPPCANWNCWRGPEVEGTEGLGLPTLFIRRLPGVARHLTDDQLTLNGSHKRVWFCKEFTDWKLLRRIAKLFESVGVEATPQSYENIPKDIRDKHTIYLKVDVRLKRGDHVCIGPAFHDEIFVTGKGVSMDPQEYLKDIKIL